MKTVTILGEGAWGTAVATLLAYNGYEVKLWCHDARVADEIVKKHVNNRYFAGITLDKKIIPVISLEDAVCGSEWIFEAIPIVYLRSVLLNARSCFSSDQTWVVLSKGIEKDTLFLPTQIIDDIYGANTKKAVVVGPSYAHEVASHEVTATTVASESVAIVLSLQKILANDFFRPYASVDTIGVQVGAALKNVIALGVGILDGIGCNDNMKAFFITRGLAEMAKLAHALGGKEQTVYGLSGVGDLILTSMGRLSRNLEVGRRIGKGEQLATILQQTGYTPEGINTVVALHQYIQKYQLSLPISEMMYQVLFENESIMSMVQELVCRPLEWE